MAIYPSRQQKSQNLNDATWILAYLAIVGILMIAGFNTNMQYHSLSRVSGGQTHVNVGISMNAEAASFASDERYWSASCSHGWTEDSACDAIVLRSQSCTIGNVSAYCSSYEEYLRQFHK